MKNEKKKKLKVLVHPHFQKQMGLEPSENCRPLEECIDEMEVWSNKWYNKYFIFPFHRYFLNKIKNSCWAIRYFIQRLFRGYDDREIFELGFYLKKWIAPRLEKLIQTKSCGVPFNPDTKKYLTEKQWDKVLKKILWLAKDSEKEEGELWSVGNVNKKWDKFYKKQREASNLLGKYLNNLWD